MVSKQNKLLIVFHIICVLLFIPVISIIVEHFFQQHLPIGYIVGDILGMLLFCFPYIVFVFLSIKIFKDKFSKLKVLTIVLLVISSLILLLYLVAGIVGISSSIESIRGSVDGYIISATKTQDQLIHYYKIQLVRTICSVGFVIFSYICTLLCSIKIFKNTK